MSIKIGQKYRHNLTNEVVVVRYTSTNNDGSMQVFYGEEANPNNIASVKDFYFLAKHTLMMEEGDVTGEIPDLPRSSSKYCFHKWVKYEGFRESYYYCEKCEETKALD